MRTKRLSISALLIATLVIALSARPAGAHTGFESSTPADGDVIDAPVSEIVLRFSGEATPAGEGFVILDPAGTLREPDEVRSADNLTWALRFDEPLAGGVVGVRWLVAAPDAHPIDGSFSFTVDALPAPEQPDGSEPETGVVQPERATPEATEAGVDADDATNEPSAAVADEASDSVGAEETTTAAASASAPVDLESFLDPNDAGPGAAATVASAARVLNILGAVLVIGAAAFAAFGLRGDATDVHAVLYWVRRGSVIILAAALAEAASMTAVLSGGWSGLASPGDLRDALWSSAGLAVGLRLIGSTLVATKTAMHTAAASATGDPIVAARQLATVGGGNHASQARDRAPDEPFVYADDAVWDHRLALGSLAGVGLVAVSFIFDGHTAAEGPLVLHAIANAIHVTTASIWAGGVAMLAFTIHRRSSSGRPTQALQLAMRFSVIATFALVAAGLAGVGLSAIILGSISEIWSTPWGRLLALKVGLVAIAAAGGAYNHRIVVPALDRSPNHQPTIDRFRTIVTLEAAALLSVAIVTAFLIAASAT